VVVEPGQQNPFENVVLRTEGYEFLITQFGNMIIRAKNSQNDILWESHTSIRRIGDIQVKTNDGLQYFADSKIRLRITKFGHILLEAENMFTKQSYSPFNQTVSNKFGIDEKTTYTIIWSNVPKHLRYQIGTLKTGYNLVLEEVNDVGGSKKVDLNLYDGGGSIVWCALLCESPVSNGFRFPDNYLLPADVETHFLDKGYVDNTPHNTLDPSIEYVKGYSFLSQNQPGNCGPILVSGQGIKSPNGRFKLILQNSGNLVLKDGIRTMWESMTGDKWYAEGPYSMRLSNRGILYVIDKWNKLIFSTALQGDQMQFKNTKLTLEDNGEFVISHSLNGTIVTNYFSFPQYNIFNEPLHVCYSKCQECRPMRPISITKLYSNGSDFTDVPFMFNNTEKMCSSSGNSCVEFKDKVLGISFNNTFSEIKKFEQIPLYLAFDLDGRLQVFSSEINILLWNNTNSINGIGAFTSSISESGRWSVFDHAGNEIWYFANKIPEHESCSDSGECQNGTNCCISPGDLKMKCRANCLAPIENGNLCNGITDFCKDGGACCFGKNSFELKCRSPDSCVSKVLDGDSCDIGGVPCENGTCCYGFDDFQSKCRDASECVSLIRPGDSCRPDEIPCAGEFSCCFGENEFSERKCRAKGTCVFEPEIGALCNPDVPTMGFVV
jgi:hypothetical protein